jgi:hypothetical protein
VKASIKKTGKGDCEFDEDDDPHHSENGKLQKGRDGGVDRHDRGSMVYMEDLETGHRTSIQLSESDYSRPKHPVGCTPHECHGAMMLKQGIDIVTATEHPDSETKVTDMKAFLTQFYEEVSPEGLDLQARLTEAEQSIRSAGTYEQTFPELEYGARLAWRNAGRCIMRQVSFGLVLRDCRHITTARECFEEVVKHLVEASNGGVLVPQLLYSDLEIGTMEFASGTHSCSPMHAMREKTALFWVTLEGWNSPAWLLRLAGLPPSKNRTSTCCPW